jgi:hypothetical protein
MFRKLGTGSKKWVSEVFLCKIGPLKTKTNYLQKHYGLSLVNLNFLET